LLKTCYWLVLACLCGVAGSPDAALLDGVKAGSPLFICLLISCAAVSASFALLQVRVMPRCWLVLMRFWLRVDGCLVRLRDVRHFCRWAPVLSGMQKFCAGLLTVAC
jgi:hypothetical protein